uniref:Uncharacterized protein n=1 Tax=viral metagenome TaxID=1070528 RepID=A0A6M3KYZ5_9ZZZZ
MRAYFLGIPLTEEAREAERRRKEEELVKIRYMKALASQAETSDIDKSRYASPELMGVYQDVYPQARKNLAPIGERGPGVETSLAPQYDELTQEPIDFGNVRMGEMGRPTANVPGVMPGEADPWGRVPIRRREKDVLSDIGAATSIYPMMKERVRIGELTINQEQMKQGLIAYAKQYPKSNLAKNLDVVLTWPFEQQKELYGPIVKQMFPEEVKPGEGIKDFELTTFGRLVPEFRGTPEYKKERMDYILETKKQSPYVDVLDRQTQTLIKREATALRKEFNQTPEVKQFSDIRFRYDVMNQALEESKTTNNFVAVDQAIITTFNKMTDPSSVVRESEYLRTASDLALWNRIKGKMQKFIGGGAALTQEDREAMFKMAGKFMKAAEKKYNERLKEYRSYMINYSVDPDTYLMPYGIKETGEIPPTQSTAPKEEYEIGGIYEDAKGDRKKYLGNGQWGDYK